MSLIRVYLLVKTFVFKNEHLQLVFKLKTTPLKIRALISDGRWRPSSLMENPDNLSENFDASVKILPPPFPTAWESDAILKVSSEQRHSVSCTTKKEREKRRK